MNELIIIKTTVKNKITRENRRIIYELVANIFSIPEAKVKIGEYQRGNSFIKPQHGIK